MLFVMVEYKNNTFVQDVRNQNIDALMKKKKSLFFKVCDKQGNINEIISSPILLKSY